MRYKQVIKVIQDAIDAQNETLDSHNRTIADTLKSLEQVAALSSKTADKLAGLIRVLNSQETSQET